MNEEVWKKIVVVHNTNKSLFIWCEENGVELRTFLQPHNELKNAYEHLVRAKANELGLAGGPPDASYISANLEKVLAHEYRAFYDICDWVSMTLRKQMIDLLGPYDNETINTVVPNYYSDLRPKLDKLCTDIGNLRSSKDIALGHVIHDHVTAYTKIIDTLIESLSKITSSIPALEEHKKRKAVAEARGARKVQTWGIIKGVFLVLLGVALALLFKNILK
ncbi:MAG: hypothetical protein NT154_47410 [Verrucomicrobia bacterium]|nr:hypothetical protein [Verrucomicrobiota bacterium]